MMGRGRALALVAVLAVMVCGCLAAQADAFVYWPDNVALGRANLDGSGVDGSFIVGADHPAAVAVDALPLAPSASITTPASGATYMFGQAVDSSFTCSGADTSGFAGRVSPTHKLSLGSYTTTITATNASGESSAPSRCDSRLSNSPKPSAVLFLIERGVVRSLPGELGPAKTTYNTSPCPQQVT